MMMMIIMIMIIINNNFITVSVFLFFFYPHNSLNIYSKFTVKYMYKNLYVLIGFDKFQYSIYRNTTNHKKK